MKVVHEHDQADMRAARESLLKLQEQIQHALSLKAEADGAVEKERAEKEELGGVINDLKAQLVVANTEKTCLNATIKGLQVCA